MRGDTAQDVRSLRKGSPMRTKSKRPRSDESAKETGDASRRPDGADTGKGSADPGRVYGGVARKIFELGGTEADIAEALNVTRKKVASWRAGSPGFAEACMQGIEKANSEVQQTLFKMATGYERIVEDVRFYQGRVTRIKYRKSVPAHLGAVKVWLLNRYSEKWNSKPEPEEKENPLARLFREIQGTSIRPIYECGNPVPFSIEQGEADWSAKEVEIEKEKEMVKMGVNPYRREERAIFNRFYKK